MEKIRETKSGTAAQESARVSMTDPEARIMKQSDGGFAPSYNVQLSTDAANKIIVGAAVSQSGSDYTEWVGAVKRVEENLQAKEIYRQRGAIAEFPSAWLKDQLGLRQFRLRGLAKVLLEVPMTDDESRTKTKRTKDQGPRTWEKRSPAEEIFALSAHPAHPAQPAHSVTLVTPVTPVSHLSK